MARATRNNAPTGAETDAPAVDAPAETDAPTDAPAVEAPLGALATTETIAKAARVFRTIKTGDADASAPDAVDPSTTYAVQREVRADGSDGPLMLAVIRRRKTGKAGEIAENATRVALADVEGARAALLSVGVRVFAAE